mmetsp:Transcript_40346/g.49156  ORF Transcript_40346/g.49156 Transcript_40346/m.49156 type:complete len:174 (+) Transcript_40346:212-733(+)|eukprot:CAMPEP_0172499886 /NCGR_PEP_ID=MMETSP1066-20121228/132210_1 /TAXON_ID=671091 /ORGANISM="Coscinodiscus wailesii, Strain CCMP2513" /LENGTH=173 /DNA_ID=CAMNT_0013273873 /DNA_START=197 /DNA_END=718 /DNA_ORIENTATION=-
MADKVENSDKLDEQSEPTAATTTQPSDSSSEYGDDGDDSNSHASEDSDEDEEEELLGDPLRTSSTSLQTKLDKLAKLALDDNREEFVKQFVPLDLSPADTAAYLDDLTKGPEAEYEWNNLISEVAVIAEGKGVKKIEGDQVETAVFYFRHPTFKDCDREVIFVCKDGEWRAEG